MAAGIKGQLRIDLTISGAIALGAYEGGVLAASLAVAQTLNEEKPGALAIDAMAGASATTKTLALAQKAMKPRSSPESP